MATTITVSHWRDQRERTATVKLEKESASVYKVMTLRGNIIGRVGSQEHTPTRPLFGNVAQHYKPRKMWAYSDSVAKRFDSFKLHGRYCSTTRKEAIIDLLVKKGRL